MGYDNSFGDTEPIIVFTVSVDGSVCVCVCVCAQQECVFLFRGKNHVGSWCTDVDCSFTCRHCHFLSLDMPRGPTYLLPHLHITVLKLWKCVLLMLTINYCSMLLDLFFNLVSPSKWTQTDSKTSDMTNYSLSFLFAFKLRKCQRRRIPEQELFLQPGGAFKDTPTSENLWSNQLTELCKKK